MAAGYVVSTVGSLALAAATAKTILSVISGANALTRIVELSVSFDGVTATAVPAVVELVSSTQASAGTPGTAPTIYQLRGPTRTVQATATQNYSAEPTVLSPWKRWLVPVFNGLLVVQFPLGREPEQIVTADALGIRVTAPAIVNVSAFLEFEEG